MNPANRHTHICPPAKMNMLPNKIMQDAQQGNTKEIKDWIASGGNINSGTNTGQTLLHFACRANQTEVVKALLEHPDIHLNIRSNGATPLGVAVAFGCHDIVEMFLELQHHQCGAADNGILVGQNYISSPATVAAERMHWKTIQIFLKHYRWIRESEALEILCLALENYEFGIAETLLQLDYGYSAGNFSNYLEEAYMHNKWSIVEAIVVKNLLHDVDTSKTLLHFLISKKDWKNLESLLRLMNDSQDRIHVSLVESVLSRKEEEVTALLDGLKDEHGIMPATLLVACVGGTSEEIADLLVNDIQFEFSAKTMDNALILSSMNHRLEFVPLLLLKKNFTYSYKVLSRAKQASRRSVENDTTDLLQAVLEEVTKQYCEKQTQ